MIKRRYFCGGSLLSVAFTLGMAASAAAQATSTRATDVEEVVVTGSFIAGTPEDAALPVDVLSAAELERQGSPTVVQLVKTITSSQSALGESNRYNGGAGTASINLRGFGAARTLTLMNGRRLAESPAAAFQGGGANLNFIPTAAIGRIEILKEGAAATYGSEAIGGVVNFITRRDLNGLEVDGEYAFIDGSNGDYSVNAAWGWRGDTGNILLTAGYRHRSRLDIHERDWAVQPYEMGGAAGAGGWSVATMPGFLHLNNTPAGTFAFRAPGCLELGGTLTNEVPLSTWVPGAAAGTTVGVPVNSASPANFASRCRFQFSNFNDLVETENHYQLHGEVNLAVTDDITAHFEATWARDDVPKRRLSPANLTAQYPSSAAIGGTSFSQQPPLGPNLSVRYNIPGYHPAVQDLLANCAAMVTAGQLQLSPAIGGCAGLSTAVNTPVTMGGITQEAGLDLNQLLWRMISFAGHPTNPDGADHSRIEQQAWRVSGGLKGSFGAINFDTALTYMEATQTFQQNDLVVRNIQMALRGFGNRFGDSNTCTAAETNNFDPSFAGRTDLGCHFFNPFASGIAASAVTGENNPLFRSNVGNDPLVVRGLYGSYTNVSTNQIVVADAVLSGRTGLELGGGPVAWAAGTQWRYVRELRKFGPLFNAAENPCPDRPACAAATGPLIFFGSDIDRDDDQTVFALFGELSIPILDTLDVSLAIRHEEYKGNIGSTTNPKLAVRWQVLDWLALRGSVGTTFRAPQPGMIRVGCTSGVALLQGAYRAVETCGNPDLKPETADAYNAGAIVKFGGFSATLDYFRFEFEDELTIESASRMVATLAAPGGCSIPDLVARFTFAGPCSPTNIARVQANWVNGPGTKTSGVDFRAQYDWDAWLDGSWSLGLEATYLIEYDRGAFTLLNSDVKFADPEDRAGKHDLLSQFFSYPQLRANAFLTFNRGPLTARWQVRYTEGTEPAFGTVDRIFIPDASAPFGYRYDLAGKSKDYWQHDLTVRYEAGWDTVVTLSVQNVFDKDPPYAASQYNYDYTNGNPLGRVFEIGVKKRF